MPTQIGGATSPDVHALVAALAQRPAANSADCTTRRAALTRAQCISRCHQALLMALQCGISLSVIYAWGKALPATSGHPPDLGAYRRVTLLTAYPEEKRPTDRRRSSARPCCPHLELNVVQVCVRCTFSASA
jgi:hypothetical protein